MAKKRPDVEMFIKARLDNNGHEVVSSIPMEPPLGYKKQPSMVDHIRNMVKSEMLRKEAEAAGLESFEEADDFDIADDPIDPSTPYEETFDPAPVPLEGARTPPVGGAAPSPPAPTPAPAPAREVAPPPKP